MSNKQLNENQIVNELKGNSLFFAPDEAHDRPSREKRRGSDSVTEVLDSRHHNPALSTFAPVSPAQGPSQDPTHPLPKAFENLPQSSELLLDQSPKFPSTEITEPPPPDSQPQIPPIDTYDNKDGEQSIANASMYASRNASMLAREQDRIVEEIRKTIKSYGKEISYVRLTPEEKDLLAEITYTYKRQGIKTSENEINRIAVNFLLADFKEHGEASILNRVIEALLA